MLNDLSSDESKRRAAIDLLKNADEGRDEALKKYTHLVCQLLKMPMSFVSILDDEKQYIKSAQNIAPTDTSLAGAFCDLSSRSGGQRSAIHSLLCRMPAENPRRSDRGYLEYLRYATQGTFR